MSGQGPFWWDWEFELSPHLLKRMIDRRFTETDLRMMIEDANGVFPGETPGRFVLESLYEGRRWRIIVEPDIVEMLVVVVTAYPID